MTLLHELVEDAFLQALEEGANPPRAFRIYLPRGSMNPRDDGHEFRVAGYVLTLCLDPEEVK